MNMRVCLLCLAFYIIGFLNALANDVAGSRTAFREAVEYKSTRIGPVEV